jgi:hypothetical protein
MKMRIRAALASVGIASMALVGMTTHTAHAASWVVIAGYSTKTECVDAGQQYEREGYPYKCNQEYFQPTSQWLWFLYISE